MHCRKEGVQMNVNPKEIFQFISYLMANKKKVKTVSKCANIS